MMNKRPRIVVVGSLIFDFVANADRLPRKGETVVGKSFGMFTGGKGANQAVQASRLGAEVYMIGRVGNDFLGDKILSNLQNDGVSIDFIRKDETATTAACCIHVDENGDNAIIISQDANMTCTHADIDNAKEIILSADIVICQLEISMPAIIYAIEMVKSNHIPLILNPAPPVKIPEGLFSGIDVLTPNETEAEFFSGISQKEDFSGKWEEESSNKILDTGAKNVIITLGKRGAYIANRESKKTVKGFEIKAVDATAAGDAFNGALAIALSEGKTLEEAVKFANGAGALAASKSGAQASLCTRKELDNFLNTRE
jgi:ribokinase